MMEFPITIQDKRSEYEFEALCDNHRCAWPGCPNTNELFNTYELFEVHLNTKHSIKNPDSIRDFVQIEKELRVLNENYSKSYFMVQQLTFHNKLFESASKRKILVYDSDNEDTLDTENNEVMSLQQPLDSSESNDLTEIATTSANVAERLTITESEQSIQNNTLQELKPWSLATEFQTYRMLYMNNDIYPPFSNVSLVRQSIIESENRGLTLDEILEWYKRNFAFYRKACDETTKSTLYSTLKSTKYQKMFININKFQFKIDDDEYINLGFLKLDEIEPLSNKHVTRRYPHLANKDIIEETFESTRKLYQLFNITPRYSYSFLISKAIKESPEGFLSIKEICERLKVNLKN